MATRTSGTVEKALAILDTFSDVDGPQSVSLIAQETGIHISTVVRLCATLEGRGYLRRETRGSFTLGPRLNELANTYSRQLRLEGVLRPILRKLRDELGESASFYVRDGDMRVCLYRENSHHSIRHHLDEGARLPLSEGVVGPVLLAFSGAKGEVYERIRADGYFDHEGRESFTASVSAPVLSRAGEVVGALVVSGPHARFTAERRKLALSMILENCATLRALLPGGARH